jgi:hypothetical protein
MVSITQDLPLQASLTLTPHTTSVLTYWQAPLWLTVPS